MHCSTRRRLPARLLGLVALCCALGLFTEAANAADTQLPTVVISAPASGATISGTRTVSGTASDNVAVSKIEIRVDNNAYQTATGTTSWSFSLNTTAYPTGAHTLYVRATDSSGNQAWTSRPVTISNVTDTQIPSVLISSPLSGATISGTRTVSGTASDNVAVSKIEIRVDNNAYQTATGTTSWSFSLNTTAYPTGAHTLYVRATDSSGNQAWTSRPVTISNVTDTQIPSVLISSPLSGATISGTRTVSGTASDNVAVSKIEIRVDNNAYQTATGTTSWSFSLNTTAYPTGAHTLYVRATDSSGNQAWTSRPVTISNVTDTQIPSVLISSPLSGATISGTRTVSGTASDNVAVSKIEIRVDNNAYQTATGTTSWSFSLNTTAYPTGAHTLYVRATDSSGNQAWTSRPVTISNVTDTQIPSVLISSPLSGATISGTRTVSGTASDNVAVSKIEIRVDNNAYQTATGTTSWSFSLNTTAYPTGAHTLYVRATDSSGNQAWTSRPVTISTSTTGSKIYWGGYLEGEDTYHYLYGGTWGNVPWASNTWNRFESNAGKKASIVYWGVDAPWTHDFNYWVSSFNLVQNRGELSLVGMLTGTVPLKDIASGKYDTQLKTWLQQAAAWGHPFFLLLDPEMNGTWASYSPGKNGNTAADFVNMWRHFHDLAVQVGATNITWVWCPNVDPAGLYTPYSQLYPGDAYVDWTGFNGFNKDGKSSFSWLFGSSYNTLRQVAPSKPILISETSAEETVGNKAAWITDTFSTQLPKNFPQIKAVVWFNWRFYQLSKWWNYEIESSPATQQAFKTAIASSYYLAGGGLGNLPLRTKISPP